VTVDRFTATLIALDTRGAKRCVTPAAAGSERGEVGGCTPPGWPNIGQNGGKGLMAPPLGCRAKSDHRK
jgi:hypothetical protein